MAAMHSRRQGRPPRLLKGGTATTKSHRFETFSQRIGKLKIDPVHRVHRNSFGEDDSNNASSYFSASLKHWTELNLSENFTQFSHCASRLSESVPQILHHEDQIMELLVDYIAKKDELCMEPLLDLMAQFARDLGSKFERHFASAVTLVASIAASHSQFEVIEWSFTCLAWIFKFLSRLLAPDLRPLLRIMSPYLGKERQKHFVAKFAAESISFLLRKAALVYYKDKAPLERAVTFLFEDLSKLCDGRQTAAYQDGLMTMFSEAIRGVKGGTHSTGPDILRCIINFVSVEAEGQNLLTGDVLSGVLVNLINHIAVDKFSPLLDVILDHIETGHAKFTSAAANVHTRLIFLSVTAGKGSRVQDWKGIHRVLLTLLQRSAEVPDTGIWPISQLLTAVAVAIQTSPMDELLPHMCPIMDAVAHERLSKYFLPFCSLFSGFGAERFHSVVLPYLQRFVTSLWPDNEESLCLVLPRLHDAHLVTSQHSKPGLLICPNSWKEAIAKRFTKTNPTFEDVALLNSYTKLPYALSLSTKPSLLPHVLQSLHHLVQSAMQSRLNLGDDLNVFSHGQGFLAYVQLATHLDTLDSHLWTLICKTGPNSSNMSIFLEAALAYITCCPDLPDVSEEQVDLFETALVNNLSSPSHQLRLLSLKILQAISRRANHDPSCISVAIEIEESEMTLQTSRFLSMQVRRLAIEYAEVSSKKRLDGILPNFCFGLLSKKLASLWQDACEAAKYVSKNQTGESIIAELALRWLQADSTLSLADTPSEEKTELLTGSLEFQCPNVSNVEKASSASFQEIMDTPSMLLGDFKNIHATSRRIPVSSRSQALRILNAVPHLAEKRSRQLVPLFLSWASRGDGGSNAVESESKTLLSLATDDGCSVWTMRDRKAMLTLFGQFANPKVLYRSGEVHEALHNLLISGDSEIQKFALKAVFTWKSLSIQPYEENLLNILDDARLRDELAVFVHVGRDNSIIKEDHREELLPLLLRLLYGRAIARGGSRNGQGGQEGRRKAILRTISQLSESDFEYFIRVSFGSLGEIRVIGNGHEEDNLFSCEFMDFRRQFGLLKMIETMFETLQNRMVPYVDRCVNVILYSLVRACRQIRDSPVRSITDSNLNIQATLLRNIRQTGIRCLDLAFSISLDVDWNSYLPIIFRELINPRLENFAGETAQGVSGLLRLFRTWTSDPRSALYFVSYNDCVITRIVDCLVVESVRDEVKVFVMDQILSGLIDVAGGGEVDKRGHTDFPTVNLVRSKVLSPYVGYILLRLESLLRSQSARQLTISSVDTLSKLAPFAESNQEFSSLISTITYLLRQPADRVPPRTKGRLLHVMEHFMPLYDPQDQPEVFRQAFEVVSLMFDYFRDDENREILCHILSVFATHDTELNDVAVLCTDINSFTTCKLGGLDFERRLAAFAIINEHKFESFTAREWRPLLFNMLYYVKDEEELAIRSSASFGLKRFIQTSAPKAVAGDDEFADLVNKALLPALRNGVQQPTEIVRAEFVSILGCLVKLHPMLPAVIDMAILLANGDEEASFFNNILHIQQHRRLRALRRLAAEAGAGKVQPSNICTIFLPLIEHFVFSEAGDENAHNLTAETISTIGVISEGLEWRQFRAILQRYKGYVQSKPDLQKNVLKLLSQLTDTLSRAMDTKHMDQENQEVNEGGINVGHSLTSSLSRSLPNKSLIIAELSKDFIPFLTDFLRRRDESEASLRLPVAITAVKLLKLLPEEETILLLPPVLLDISNILKSRSQETRDAARKTLADIALLLGPAYIGYILKELRRTLTKGYQLHVLSFTVHSILVTTDGHFKPGDSDHSIVDLVAVVMDDIFGTAGQEKDAEEYISKMKEVKSNKSYDSMELLAKNATIRHLPSLLHPLQELLYENLTSKLVKKIDELFRRIGTGLLRNPDAESRDFLVLSYEIIKESYQSRAAAPEQTFDDQSKERFMVNLSGPRQRANSIEMASPYSHKLARFGFDILRSIMNKYGSLLTAENLSGFLPLIGDAVVQGYEEVKVSAMRLLTTIIKLPLPEIDKNSDVYLTEAVKLVKEAQSTSTEAAQAALKLIAAILRERQVAKLRDSHLAYLLKRLSADVEEPARQGVTFNFVKAVMARKFIVPEIYELVDNIAVMMVTNHSRSARDLARGVYVHFVVEYPQAKSRWTKQLSFLAKNLQYQHQEGRQSVMEAVHLLLSKTNGDLAQDIVGTFFVPVLMAMSNDESSNCREMAGALLGALYGRADSEQLKSILTTLRPWLEQTENSMLTVTGLQAMRIYFEADGTGKENEVTFVTSLLPRIVGAAALKNANNDEWEVSYYALQLFAKLCRLFPALTVTEECALIWRGVLAGLYHPHSWVKSCSANLIGIWLADEARANAVGGYGSVPLVGASGLTLDDVSMLDITRASMLSLKSPSISEDLATQTIRNMIFLGRCFAKNNVAFSREKSRNLTLDLSDSTDAESGDVPSDSTPRDKPAVQYIFEHLCTILRCEPITTRAESLVSKTASIKLLGALCSHLELANIVPSLQAILLPLLHLTDQSIAQPRSADQSFESTYKDLVTSSQEVLELLQKKLGTTEFVDQMTVARETVKARREGRRVKRRIETLADPEKFGREKRRKNDRKREKRKEKGLEFRDRRRGW